MMKRMIAHVVIVLGVVSGSWLASANNDDHWQRLEHILHSFNLNVFSEHIPDGCNKLLVYDIGRYEEMITLGSIQVPLSLLNRYLDCADQLPLLFKQNEQLFDPFFLVLVLSIAYCDHYRKDLNDARKKQKYADNYEYVKKNIIEALYQNIAKSLKWFTDKERLAFVSFLYPLGLEPLKKLDDCVLEELRICMYDAFSE